MVNLVLARKHRYSFKSLMEIHESELERANDPTQGLEFDSVYCLSCGEDYDITLPVCPRCHSKRTP